MKRLIRLLAVALCLCSTAFAQAADARARISSLIQHPRVRLAPQVEELRRTNGIVQFHFSFGADAEQRVPGILMKAESSRGRRPTVIALHGTGGSKETMLSLGRKLAINGFVAVAMDGR